MRGNHCWIFYQMGVNDDPDVAVTEIFHRQVHPAWTPERVAGWTPFCPTETLRNKVSRGPAYVWPSTPPRAPILAPSKSSLYFSSAARLSFSKLRLEPREMLLANARVLVQYHFRCPCGAPIRATEKTATCADCGRNFGIRRNGRRVWSTTPHRRLHLGDLGPLVLQIVLFFFLAYYVYDFGQYVCDVLTD